MTSWSFKVILSLPLLPGLGSGFPNPFLTGSHHQLVFKTALTALSNLFLWFFSCLNKPATLWFKPVAVCQICNVYAEQYIFIAATSCVAAIWRPLFFFRCPLQHEQVQFLCRLCHFRECTTAVNQARTQLRGDAWFLYLLPG